VPGKIEKMGYKGVDTTEMVFDGTEIDARPDPRRSPGQGFYQMMDGVEVGRVNVAASACGLARRAFELGIEYSQQRETFGKKIAEHQAVLFRLAEMATQGRGEPPDDGQGRAAKDSGERNDLEAGMAKYLASEYCAKVVEDSFRIHGGYGFSKEYEIERLYREAPMLLIGEGTADIQKMIIGVACSRTTGSRAEPAVQSEPPMSAADPSGAAALHLTRHACRRPSSGCSPRTAESRRSAAVPPRCGSRRGGRG
jgi:alkylation response protein AidB-like acyl-CoA dehydrogenase